MLSLLLCPCCCWLCAHFPLPFPSFSASFENGTESNQLNEFDKQHRIFTSLSLVNFSKYQCLSTFSLNFCSPIVGAALSPWRGMNLVLQHQEWSCWWGLHNSYDACSTICKTSKLGFCLNSHFLIVFCWKKMVVMFFKRFLLVSLRPKRTAKTHQNASKRNIKCKHTSGGFPQVLNTKSMAWEFSTEKGKTYSPWTLPFASGLPCGLFLQMRGLSPPKCVKVEVPDKWKSSCVKPELSTWLVGCSNCFLTLLYHHTWQYIFRIL